MSSISNAPSVARIKPGPHAPVNDPARRTDARRKAFQIAEQPPLNDQEKQPAECSAGRFITQAFARARYFLIDA
jgi:hypothetical protein